MQKMFLIAVLALIMTNSFAGMVAGSYRNIVGSKLISLPSGKAETVVKNPLPQDWRMDDCINNKCTFKCTQTAPGTHPPHCTNATCTCGNWVIHSGYIN